MACFFFFFFFIKSETKFRHKNRNYPLLLFMPNENAVLSKFLIRQLLGSCDTECFRLIMSSATGLSKRTYLSQDEIQFQELSITIRVFSLFITFFYWKTNLAAVTPPLNQAVIGKSGGYLSPLRCIILKQNVHIICSKIPARTKYLGLFSCACLRQQFLDYCS